MLAVILVSDIFLSGNKNGNKILLQIDQRLKPLDLRDLIVIEVELHQCCDSCQTLNLFDKIIPQTDGLEQNFCFLK